MWLMAGKSCHQGASLKPQVIRDMDALKNRINEVFKGALFAFKSRPSDYSEREARGFIRLRQKPGAENCSHSAVGAID